MLPVSIDSVEVKLLSCVEVLPDVLVGVVELIRKDELDSISEGFNSVQTMWDADYKITSLVIKQELELREMLLRFHLQKKSELLDRHFLPRRKVQRRIHRRMIRKLVPRNRHLDLLLVLNRCFHWKAHPQYRST